MNTLMRRMRLLKYALTCFFYEILYWAYGQMIKEREFFKREDRELVEDCCPEGSVYVDSKVVLFVGVVVAILYIIVLIFFALIFGFLVFPHIGLGNQPVWSWQLFAAFVTTVIAYVIMDKMAVRREQRDKRLMEKLLPPGTGVETLGG